MNTKKHFILSLLLTIVLVSSSLFSQAQKYTEYEVKLVYLYQFSKFVNWPPETFNKSDYFLIGVYGYNPFGNLPELMFKDRPFKGKPCKVIEINSVEEAKNCHMVFFSGLRKFDAIQFIKKLGPSPVLLVGDEIEDFCNIGGVINLTSKESKYRFILNPVEAEYYKISISSKLYSVAKVVGKNFDEF